MTRSLALGLALASAVIVPIAAPAAAQDKPLVAATQGTQGIKRIPLQKFDVPGTAGAAIMGIAEIAPGASVGRHTHFGVEAGYMLSGTATLLVDGQPPREMKAGDSYVVPAGAVHDAKAGPDGAKVIATYVVEKGKPLATPSK